jgi:hypothetical protein
MFLQSDRVFLFRATSRPRQVVSVRCYGYWSMRIIKRVQCRVLIVLSSILCISRYSELPVVCLEGNVWWVLILKDALVSCAKELRLVMKNLSLYGGQCSDLIPQGVASEPPRSMMAWLSHADRDIHSCPSTGTCQVETSTALPNLLRTLVYTLLSFHPFFVFSFFLYYFISPIFLSFNFCFCQHILFVTSEVRTWPLNWSSELSYGMYCHVK